MLEDDVDALLLRQLADDALEAVLAVVDDVVGAERLRLLDLVVRADGGDDGAAHALGKLDRSGTDAGAAGMDQDRLAGFQLGVVEQHVLDGAEGDGSNGGADLVHSRRSDDQQAGRQVHQLLRKSVEMKAVDATDMLAEIVALLAASTAMAAGARAVDRNELAVQEVGDAITNCLDHA